jgi:recombination protein RecT
MSAQIVPVRERVNSVAKYIQHPSFIEQLRMALPRSGVTADRMARIVITEIRRNPQLAECSVESLLGAIMQCAQLGLEPGPMGLAYLIPYGKEAQLQVGYKGLLNLIWRSEQIASVQAEVVHERDQFTYANGIPPELRHIPARGDRGALTHVYAVIGTKTGGWIFRVMTTEEVNDHRARFSKAGKSGKPTPWDTDWSEMACKTVLKRTGKRAPVSTEVQVAIALDDKAEIGVPQEIEIAPPEIEASDSAPEPPKEVA